jgi:hypothetical protein
MPDYGLQCSFLVTVENISNSAPPKPGAFNNTFQQPGLGPSNNLGTPVQQRVNLTNSSTVSAGSGQIGAGGVLSPALSAYQSPSTRNDDRIVPVLHFTPESSEQQPFEKELNGIIRVGRSNDEYNSLPNVIAYKSRVVSRNHAEFWADEKGDVINKTGI